jgi:hypothetical protein
MMLHVFAGRQTANERRDVQKDHPRTQRQLRLARNPRVDQMNFCMCVTPNGVIERSVDR